MTRRPPPRRHPALALALAGAALVGCSPVPAPTPSATPVFASEEEAFAAAEATYRAYVDALNAVDLSDPKTFEAVYEHLSSTAASSTRKSFSEFHSEGVVMRGQTSYANFHGASAELVSGDVRSHVCLDVGDVSLTAPSGDSLVAHDRPDRQPLAVTFETVGGDGMRIVSMQPDGEVTCTD